MQLFGDLFNNEIVTSGDERETGYLRFQGLCDTEALDIESAAAEQAGYP